MSQTKKGAEAPFVAGGQLAAYLQALKPPPFAAGPETKVALGLLAFADH
jgi:hypothetical protein